MFKDLLQNLILNDENKEVLENDPKEGQWDLGFMYKPSLCSV